MGRSLVARVVSSEQACLDQRVLPAVRLEGGDALDEGASTKSVGKGVGQELASITLPLRRGSRDGGAAIRARYPSIRFRGEVDADARRVAADLIMCPLRSNTVTGSPRRAPVSRSAIRTDRMALIGHGAEAKLLLPPVQSLGHEPAPSRVPLEVPP